MNEFNKPFVDYYNQHDIIPVSQDISDIGRHFQRRDALYRHCGIVPAFIKGKTVLEIGPGTGHNAVFTNFLQPEKYVLIDGAIQSVKHTKALLEASFSDISNCEIIRSTVEDYTTRDQFDLVLCEGAIPFQKNPTGFLKSLARFVKPSGLLVITCADSVSDLSETLRRVMAYMILDGKKEKELEDRLDILRPVFSFHLETLKGMSRGVDDWIYDNILQPIIGEPISIAQAVLAMGDQFDAYGASPHIFSDFRWYKDIHSENIGFNENAVNAYQQNVHNLLDYRFVFPAVDFNIGRDIIALCDTIFEYSIEMQNQGIKISSLEAVIENLKNLRSIAPFFSGETRAAIDNFIDQTELFISSGNIDTHAFKNFAPWFGRGQQYLSFIKKNDYPVSL